MSFYKLGILLDIFKIRSTRFKTLLLNSTSLIFTISIIFLQKFEILYHKLIERIRVFNIN